MELKLGGWRELVDEVLLNQEMLVIYVLLEVFVSLDIFGRRR